ncbi:MAG TPA: ferritin family protein [Phycisphaerae bacterium]|nr:ferritin family protein [Phycisphaerae bacterium]
MAETVAFSAAISALLTESRAFGQTKEQPKDEGAAPTAERIHSQFNEEAQVAAKYAAFAAHAKIEGFPQTARLFQALVMAEMFHAEWLLRQMNSVTNTADHLKAGADYEALLASTVLPAAAKQANRENNSAAERLFQKLEEACEWHERVLRQTREHVLAGRDIEPVVIRVCPECGTVFIGSGPDKCPVCGTANAKFIDASKVGESSKA